MKCERIAGGPARMRVAPVQRARGRPETQHSSGLRERAWWLMRTLPRFTLDELLLTLVEAAGGDPASNIGRYVRQLERAGVVARTNRRAPGRAPQSNGHVIWRVARDLGRLAPVWRGSQGALWDPNGRALITPAAPAAAVPPEERAP